VIDGEVVAIDERGRSDFSLLQENLSKGMVEGLVYYAFDLLELDGEDWRGRPLRQRKARLRALLRASRASRVLFSGDWRGSASKMLAQACGAGLEGIVSKRLGDPYVGARTTSWLKAKCGLREEFVVGGFTAPRGQRQEIGALLVGSYDKQNKFIYKGKVGSGLGDRDLKALRARLRPLEARSSPFAAGPALERGARWARPELVIEAGFRSWTRDGLLRQAFFKGAREDKPARAVAAQARPSLSHPEKIMYPQEGISKAQVAAYYQGVSEYMLPFVARRPLSIVRCPDGIGGQAFYQKHLGRERPGGIYEKEIAIGGRRRRVAWIEGIDGLLALAQLAALEIHLWQATIDRPNSPDQIVLDLDPHESVSWQDVKKAAFALRDELTELKLASFVKLTGGKGLHVQVPISGISGWAQEKNLAKALAARFCERHPKKFTLSPMKGRRDGRIFIDYLRNGLGATAIAPFSLRARPGAPVALPASWEELSRVSSPAQWTMSRFLRRLERGYELPWPRPPGGSGALGY
jgi:bifunctional non-homologous end joining protein LigD